MVLYSVVLDYRVGDLLELRIHRRGGVIVLIDLGFQISHVLDPCL